MQEFEEAFAKYFYTEAVTMNLTSSWVMRTSPGFSFVGEYDERLACAYIISTFHKYIQISTTAWERMAISNCSNYPGKNSCQQQQNPKATLNI